MDFNDSFNQFMTYNFIKDKILNDDTDEILDSLDDDEENDDDEN